MRLSLWNSALLGAATGSLVGGADSSCPAQNATVDSFVYGQPLQAYQKAVLGQLASGISANEVSRASDLATSASTDVVRPNVDTLYSSVYYDLSEDDLDVSLPAIDPGRYWVIAFYDPYGDNYYNLGSLNASPAGKYRLTLAATPAQRGTFESNYSSGYQGVLYSPGTLGTVITRIVVRNTANDLETVVSLQNGFQVVTVPRKSAQVGPGLNMAVFANTSSSAVGYSLNLTDRFLDTLPGGNGSYLDADIASSLSTAGLSDLGYTTPACVNLRRAGLSAQAAIMQWPTLKGSMIKAGNGWLLFNSSKIGSYGTDYLARAYISIYGYFALTSDQAVYPSNSMNLSLSSNESYILHFSGKPPLQKTGFWSLTMYSAAGYLVENPLERYAIGDRTDLTYPNGSQVYAGDADGPFDVLIQASMPPSNWTYNWLPSPQTPGPFALNLRFYASTPAVANGSWVYPIFAKGAAILANGTSGSSSSTTSTATTATTTTAATTGDSGTASTSTVPSTAKAAKLNGGVLNLVAVSSAFAIGFFLS